jgi:hypothetical protein
VGREEEERRGSGVSRGRESRRPGRDESGAVTAWAEPDTAWAEPDGLTMQQTRAQPLDAELSSGQTVRFAGGPSCDRDGSEKRTTVT